MRPSSCIFRALESRYGGVQTRARLGAMSDQMTDVVDVEIVTADRGDQPAAGQGRAACRSASSSSTSWRTRMPDRPAESPRLHARARAADRPGQTATGSGGDAVRRPRRAEDDQRQLRPSRRRRGADPGRATCSSSGVRQSDVVARIGGDEFGDPARKRRRRARARDRRAAGRPDRRLRVHARRRGAAAQRRDRRRR